jgi:hypothetical protein
LPILTSDTFRDKLARRARLTRARPKSDGQPKLRGAWGGNQLGLAKVLLDGIRFILNLSALSRHFDGQSSAFSGDRKP